MKKYIYKTSIIIMLLSLLHTSAYAFVNTSDWIDFYSSPSDAANVESDNIFFKETTWNEQPSPFENEIDNSFIINDNPNETGEPESGLEVDAPVGTLPLIFISICILLYSMYCLIRTGNKIKKNNFKISDFKL